MKKRVKISSSRRRKTVALTVIGILVLITLIILSFIQYQKASEIALRQLKKFGEFQITDTSKPLWKVEPPSPSPTPLIWKTYIDKEYRFRLKYPESNLISIPGNENTENLFRIQNSNEGRKITFHLSFNNTGAWFEISIIPINDSATELLNKQASILALKIGDSIQLNERKIGGSGTDKYFLVHDSNIRLPSKVIHKINWDGYEYRNGWENYSTDYTYFTKHNNFIYIIHEIVESDMSLCDQIMETVELL